MKKQDKFFNQVQKQINQGFKFSCGEYEAYFAWDESRIVSDVIEVHNYIWPKDIEDFVDIMRRAGVRTFAVTTTSTGLMEMLHLLIFFDCKVIGLYKRIDETCNRLIKGILVKL